MSDDTSPQIGYRILVERFSALEQNLGQKLDTVRAEIHTVTTTLQNHIHDDRELEKRIAALERENAQETGLNLAERLKAAEGRVRHLERWQYKAIGISIGAMAVLSALVKLL